MRSATTERRFVFPVHPRTRHVLDEHGIALAARTSRRSSRSATSRCSPSSPRATPVVTDSGGLQKEAYWLRVPCVTLRPSTEWVDTVDRRREPAGRARRARGRARGGALPGRTRRRSTATDTPPSASRPPCTLDRRAGVEPLRRRRHRRRLRRCAARRHLRRGRPARPRSSTCSRTIVEALNRGESHIEDVTSERLDGARRARAHRRDDRLRAGEAGARRADRAADAALAPARAGPLLHRARRDEPRAGAPARPGRRARVDHLARHDARDPAADPRAGLGPRRPATDFHLAMSPERVDPGREDWTTKTTPKVVGGITPASTPAAADVYRAALDTVHEVSTPDAAELTKLLENIYRAVNIALVNELAQLCDRMEHRRLGGDRRSRDEAVRVRVVQAGPGSRRPLHPDRPVLPHVEGARVRLLDALHRAGGRGQQQHAVLLPLADLAGAEPRRAQVGVAGRRS